MDELTEDMRKIYRELAPCDIVMADIQASTSVGRVNDFLKICRDIEENKN